MTRSRLSSRSKRRIARSGLPPAVVLGTEVTGLAEARALQRHGIPVIGVDRHVHRYTSYSSAWTGLVITDHFDDHALIEVLGDLAEEYVGEGPLALFVSTDEQVKLISRYGAGLHTSYLFEYPSGETVDLLMSKQRFVDLAMARGWPVPKTVNAASQEELLREMEGLSYPIVMKPRIKNQAIREHGRQKAYRCANQSELVAAYREVGPLEPEVVVQEWIPGDDGDVHYSFHYFTTDLEELCSFEGRKIRQWIPEVGSTASSEPVHPPQVTATSREVLRAVGCCGFCSVEYKRDRRSGRFLITEPTVGRVNLQLGTAIANGVDLVSRAYFHLHGRPYPGTERQSYDRKWIYLSADIRSARFYVARGELTWSGWWRSLRGKRAFAVWRPSDLRMAAGAAADLTVRIPRALWRRIRRVLRAPQRALSHR